MNYQIIALDLDGTLTNSKKEISRPTLEALIKIQEQGKKVVLASGRPTTGVIPLARQLKLDRYGSYILSFNGGCIIDCRTEKVIYNKTLPLDVTAPLFKIVSSYRNRGIDILGYTPDKLLSGGTANEYSQIESRINHMPLQAVEDFPSHIKEPANKFLVTGASEIIQEVKAEIEEHFRSYLYIYMSDPFFLEIMPPGIDKAHSLLRLLTGIGLTSDEMICCGDGYNDVTMLETAGLGVAMANAQPPVLLKADYITKSNDEDGVLHVIEKFILEK